MLDNLNFRNLGQAQQSETLKRVALFHPPRAPAAAAGSAEAQDGRGDSQRVARLLASV